MVSRLDVSASLVVVFLSIPLAFVLPGCDTEEAIGATARGMVNAKMSGKRADVVSGVMITLEPIGETTGPKASAPVFSGKFNFDAEAGLHGGQYRVRFSLMPPEIRNTIPTEHAAGLPADDAAVVAKYDSQSSLTWDLSPKQTNQREFEIEIR
jgi:hypothetical protein